MAWPPDIETRTPRPEVMMQRGGHDGENRLTGQGEQAKRLGPNRHCRASPRTVCPKGEESGTG